jgi:hypothetical protein
MYTNKPFDSNLICYEKYKVGFFTLFGILDLFPSSVGSLRKITSVIQA